MSPQPVVVSLSGGGGCIKALDWVCGIMKLFIGLISDTRKKITLSWAQPASSSSPSDRRAHMKYQRNGFCFFFFCALCKKVHNQRDSDQAEEFKCSTNEGDARSWVCSNLQSLNSEFHHCSAYRVSEGRKKCTHDWEMRSLSCANKNDDEDALCVSLENVFRAREQIAWRRKKGAFDNVRRKWWWFREFCLMISNSM